MSGRPKTLRVDGYAVQNTAHVLCALKAYEVKARTASPGLATKAAIDCYVALSHKPVTGRSIRRWIKVVKSYGGIEKTPENAFGAKKSCAHFRRPARDRLREIAAEARRLSIDFKSGNNLLNLATAAELALIDRTLTDCESLVEKDPIRRHLASISQTARRIATIPISRLCLFTSEAELERALVDVLVRLGNVKRSGRPDKAS